MEKKSATVQTVRKKKTMVLTREAYEEWEEQCELLDEKIEEIEDLLED